jgi:hypothetical protein
VSNGQSKPRASSSKDPLFIISIFFYEIPHPDLGGCCCCFVVVVVVVVDVDVVFASLVSFGTLNIFQIYDKNILFVRLICQTQR